ncbi:hypothetical protein GCM10009751_06430 [Myceligenerans crystallogenes]|uniref:Uncharacterized protein n=1 Tax=Myceligenerans crystallogenes TaxID=316335 RepID=A0ABN2N5S4_9MICO
MANTSAEAVEYRKKSYHSTTVPAIEAATTLRSSDLSGAGPDAGGSWVWLVAMIPPVVLVDTRTGSVAGARTPHDAARAVPRHDVVGSLAAAPMCVQRACQHTR